MTVGYSATIGPLCQDSTILANYNQSLVSNKSTAQNNPEYTQLEIRYFNDNDREPLLEFAGTVQADNPKDSQSRSQQLGEVLRQPGFTPETSCLILEENDSIAGYCIVFSEKLIQRAVLAVDVQTDLEASETESKLIRSGLELAKNEGAGVAHICLGSQTPRASMLEDVGFHKIRTYLHMLWNGETPPLMKIPPEYSVNIFTPQDTQKLTDIQNAAFTGSWGFCPNTTEEIEYRTNMSNTRHECIVFLEDETGVVGYCWGCLGPNEGRTRGIISMIGINPRYRGKGLSQIILAAGINKLNELALDGISLHVDSSNTPAIKLYKSIGFHELDKLYWYEYTF